MSRGAPSAEFLSRVAGAKAIRCWRAISPRCIGWKSLVSVADMVEKLSGPVEEGRNGNVENIQSMN